MADRDPPAKSFATDETTDMPKPARANLRKTLLLAIAAVVLLGAFVATSAVFESGGFAGWARFAGVAVGGVLAWRRAPFVVVVVVAAATTALLRLVEPAT